MHRVRLHGLEIESEFAISGWPAKGVAPIDLRIVRSDFRSVPRSNPVAGRPGLQPFWIYRELDGFLVDLPEVAQFVVEQQAVRVSVCAGQRAEQVRSLLEGLVLSIVLVARSQLALHSSAVAFGGRTVAFVGASGAGKSTLAALLCASGAQLVADDVLHVVQDSLGPSCHAGTSRLRLRSRVRALAELLPDWAVAETHDGRLAVTPPAEPPSGLRLDAVVLPRFDPSCTSPSLRPLRGVEALTALLAAPRVPGWTDRKVLELLHARLSQLARTAHIYEATLPRLDLDTRSAVMLRELLEPQ